MSLTPYKRKRPVYYLMWSGLCLIASTLAFYFAWNFVYMTSDLGLNMNNYLPEFVFYIWSFIFIVIAFFRYIKSKDVGEDRYCNVEKLDEVKEKRLGIWGNEVSEINEFKLKCIETNGFLTSYDYDSAFSYMKEHLKERIEKEILIPHDLDISIYDSKAG